MQFVKEIVKELKVFERNKIPLEVKIFGVAIYFQTPSVRRTAKILSEIYPVTKSSVHRWIKKLQRENFNGEKTKEFDSVGRNCCQGEQKALFRLFSC